MRPILPEEKIHPSIRPYIETNRTEIVDEVRAAIEKNPVVVVGMKQNPWPRKVRTLLRQRGVEFTYLEYGSYLAEWRKRNALKMWTGWPTFPMVFVKGVLVGGYDATKALLDSGELQKMLA